MTTTARGLPAGTTLSAAASAIRVGAATSTGLVEQCIAAADACDPGLGIFLDRYRDSAREAALIADAGLAAGKVVGPLHGLPLGIKDIITTREGPTTAQSLVNGPAAMSGDACVVRRLRDSGAIVMGKLSTMEFAVGAPDASKPFPVPRNPWNPERWAGGSSSGSGSGVATGAVLGALGTDTGGSIRIPAAFCGVTGLKPTFGRVPKSGCIPLGYSLDHVGPIARSARDCALLLAVLAGPSADDPSSAREPVSDYIDALTGDLEGVRIGVDRLTRIGGGSEDPALEGLFNRALDALQAQGARVTEIELPYYSELTTAEGIVLVSEAMAYHRENLRRRWMDFGAPTREYLARGAFYSASDLVQAQRARTVGRRALSNVFTQVDLIATPTTSGVAPLLDDLFAEGLEPATSFYTGYWNATGCPALSVPMGFNAEGMPLGLQIAGPPFGESCVLRAGDAYQRATDWHLRVQSPELGGRTSWHSI